MVEITGSGRILDPKKPTFWNSGYPSLGVPGVQNGEPARPFEWPHARAQWLEQGTELRTVTLVLGAGLALGAFFTTPLATASTSKASRSKGFAAQSMSPATTQRAPPGRRHPRRGPTPLAHRLPSLEGRTHTKASSPKSNAGRPTTNRISSHGSSMPPLFSSSAACCWPVAAKLSSTSIGIPVAM